ncbi:hypothetical protein [Xanthomonas vasicola]|nr:hypothetical protein [Xanthomonas vasicola]MBV6747221.1 hypothetical protein [Xanthomonas vasicola pv. vasculorum NCPPB 890]MBV6892709.1 hypothetical protein [Xanthomonas vasicola pv. vasculorum]MDO6948366.1 hypothetical protein [Xanthomonas vasicola]MDO6960459.1 hypothetical protein [Xanthomonas vasicola]
MANHAAIHSTIKSTLTYWLKQLQSGQEFINTPLADTSDYLGREQYFLDGCLALFLDDVARHSNDDELRLLTGQILRILSDRSTEDLRVS